MEEEKINFDELPKEALIAMVKENKKKIDQSQENIKKEQTEKDLISKELEETKKRFEKLHESVDYGGMPIDKIKDIKTICQGIRVDEFYAEFLESMSTKKPEYFLNAINAKISPLMERAKQDLKDSQVDENGETLITSAKEIDNDLFNKYGSVEMIDDQFPKTYLDNKDKYKKFLNILYIWQKYIVEYTSLMEYSYHAYLIARKNLVPETKLAVEIVDKEESEELKQMKDTILGQQEQLNRLNTIINELQKKIADSGGEQAKQEDLELLETAKEDEGESVELPDIDKDEESKPKRGRRRGGE